MSTLKVTNIQSNGAGFNDVVSFQNSAGTQNGTLCRVWCNFNGQGVVALRGSFNVTSITDNSTGDYTVNFTNALSDANYCAQVSAGNNAANSEGGWNTIYNDATTLAGSCRLAFYNYSGSVQDQEMCFFAVFR